jgi:predicted dehydrogenase
MKFGNQSINRRRFLKRAAATTAAACVAPAVVPAAALGSDGNTAPSNRIVVGMLGTGLRARAMNIPQFLEMPDVQIAAVCDVDAWRLDNAKRQVEQAYAKAASSGVYRGCQACVDFRDILARKDVDAVMISACDHWHFPMAMAAFEAGKDVSLEKPITRSIAEGRALSNKAAQTGRIFRVDSELRSFPETVRAAELVRNGRIGKVHTVTVGVPGSDVGCPPQPEMPVPPELDYRRWQGSAPPSPYTERRVHKPKAYERGGWMRHLYYCDGMITNWTTHWNDVAAWCADLERTGPVEIEGTGEYPLADSFWNVLLTFEVKMRFANGVRWTYRTEKPFFKVEGTEGWIYGEHKNGHIELQTHPASLLTATVGPNDRRFYLKSDKRDFIDCVKSRQQTLEPAEVGHRVTSLGLLGQIAIQTGKKLKWNPERERFVDNDAANCFLDKPVQAPTHRKKAVS